MTLETVLPIAATICAAAFSIGAFWCANADRKARQVTLEDTAETRSSTFWSCVEPSIIGLPTDQQAVARNVAALYEKRYQKGIVTLGHAIEAARNYCGRIWCDRKDRELYQQSLVALGVSEKTARICAGVAQ